jgi:hypothetical protein
MFRRPAAKTLLASVLMRAWFTRHSQRICISILLSALLLRALIPAGSMPAVGADGWPTLVPCSGMADVQFTAGGMPAHAMHHHHVADDAGAATPPGDSGDTHDPTTSGQSHVLCAFAASTGLAPPPAIFGTIGAGIRHFPPSYERSRLAHPPISATPDGCPESSLRNGQARCTRLSPTWTPPLRTSIGE